MEHLATDTRYMALAVEEASKGQGRTSPNPCVGAVVVREEVIVGRGYHRQAGTPHAEINALAAAGSAAAGATLYVTLEPCNHTGRTPPCTHAIIEAGIARVVVGMNDPNPGVVGGGNTYLRSAGIKVEEGVLEDECRAINRPFIKHSATGLPWVTLKAGMSLDGRISFRQGGGGRITGEQSGSHAHQLRNIHDAILIGIGTARVDDPSLTTRLADGHGRDPLRVVLDRHLAIDLQARLLTQESVALTMIFCAQSAPGDKEKALTDRGAIVNRIPEKSGGRLDLRAVLEHLGRIGITSVLVEGGASVHGSFLADELVDEIYLYIAPFFIGDRGTPLISGYNINNRDEGTPMEILKISRLGGDMLLHALVRS